MQEIRELLRIGAGYVCFSLLATFVLLALFLTVYFLIYKKLLKGTKSLKPTDIIKWIMLLAYIIVILSITLDRGAFYNNYRINIMPPLYSYIEAWNSFQPTLWRNIIINFIAFMPFGFFVPLAIKKCRVFYKTYAVSFLFSLAIEITQLLTGLGIFECDDLIGNTVGAMIGYGFFSIAYSLYTKAFKSINWKKLVILQAPLLCAIISFSAIFAVYWAKDLGNLRYYIYKAPSNSYSIELNDNCDFSVEQPYLMVYKSKNYSHSQAEEYAERLMSNVGDEIDFERTIYYEETAFFWGRNFAAFKIRYDGGVEYTNFDFLNNTNKNTNATEEDVRHGLMKIGVDLPENMSFTNSGDGRYLFECDITDENNMCTGSISVQMCDDIVTEYCSDISYLEPYGKYQSISQMEAYQKIKQGKFYRSPYFDELDNIVVNGVKIEYQADTKGYYQPVYAFDVTDNSDNTVILIPALK